MRSRLPEILVLTRDLDLAHAVSLAAAAEWTEWHPGFGPALAAIRPGTRLLVIDSGLDGPLTKLLPLLFVDQREDRRAIVVHRGGDARPLGGDLRIRSLAWPASLEVLAAAIDAELAHGVPRAA